jgi:NDP-sugar pyrophosphorylase family protein/aminoglycoside/choline kinase family phosphotransferase
MKLSAFILAAGLGERLRPITDHIPKPLMPILGKPVLQSILEKVSILPVNKIGINLYHKKNLIENWIKHSDFNKSIQLFPEDIILGTGGALKNAGSFLSTGTFLVHNSDIISDIDLEKLIDSHLSSKNLITLAVHDYPEFNELAIDEKGFLKGLGRARGMPSGATTWVAFTGISVYQPEFLKFLSPGVSSIVDVWLKALDAGYKVCTADVSGCYWSDIGTPASYAKAVIDELKKNGETVYIHPSVDWCKYVDFNGYVSIEKESIVKKGVSLRNCIILPGIPPSPHLAKGRTNGRVFENCILGPGFKIDLSESEMSGLSGNPDALLIGTGGSDRKYYRVKRDNQPAVLMECAAGDPDFQRHIEYTRFFQIHAIPVPELIDTDTDKTIASFEDLGDLSLYSWLKCPREQEQIEKIYRHVIDMLILIHTVATGHITDCPLLQKRIFDYEHLRWETGYFIERFVKDIRNIRIKHLSALNNEFHRLACKVDSFPKTVIHRDFQSQNIMITKGCIPRLLDYQGARIGPPAYDLVSILWDPYYRLEGNMREKLLNYYMSIMVERIGERFSKKDFMEAILPCRLQRHMQALGAYGFLSKRKGKQYFLKFIPEGLRLLREDVSLSGEEYPELYTLVTAIP